MRQNKNRIIYFLASLVWIANALIFSAFAYSLDYAWKYNDPQSVSVYITSNVPYINNVVAACDNWNSCPEVYCYRSTNVNYQKAFITYSDVNTGAVAETSLIGGGSDWKQIVIRPTFSQISPTQREETIAHELGHCLGLNDIYEERLMPYTLMRGVDFNNNPFPFTDDKNGITALYG